MKLNKKIFKIDKTLRLKSSHAFANPNKNILINLFNLESNQKELPIVYRRLTNRNYF
jgi:hypothetical protein